METVLGKIVKAELGFGGYQESQLGLFVELSFNNAHLYVILLLVDIKNQFK